MTPAEQCLIERVKIHNKYGFGPQEDIVKHVGEQFLHSLIGGELIGGNQEGFDIIAPSGFRRNAKARWLYKFNSKGNPELSRNLKTGKRGFTNMDAITLITICPNNGFVLGAYDFYTEDLKTACSHDEYDNKQEISTAKIWNHRKVIYERPNN